MSTDKSAATVKPAKGPVRPQATASTGGTNGPIQKMQKYLGEVQTELRKTIWPTREELITQTQVVLGLLVLIGVFIAAWDFVLSQIFNGIRKVLGIG